MTHNKDINEDYTKYQEFEMHIQSEVRIWKMWHDYWVEKARNKSVPVYFFRYEDLMRDPVPILSKIFSFSLGVQSIEDTIIERRILETTSSGSSGNTLYKPRSGGGGVNRNLDKYTPEQLQFIKDKLEEHLNFFGYTKKSEDDTSNLTPFFDYEGKGKAEYTDNFDGYKALNDEVWEHWMKDFSKTQDVNHTINRRGDGISLFKEKSIIKYLNLPTKSTIKETKGKE